MRVPILAKASFVCVCGHEKDYHTTTYIDETGVNKGEVGHCKFYYYSAPFDPDRPIGEQQQHYNCRHFRSRVGGSNNPQGRPFWS